MIQQLIPPLLTESDIAARAIFVVPEVLCCFHSAASHTARAPARSPRALPTDLKRVIS